MDAEQPADDASFSLQAVVPTLRAECFMICDGVQAVQGKLYVLGGGWDRLFVAKFPTEHTVSLAVKLAIPFQDTNERLPLRMEVLGEDGQPVVPEPLSAEVEAGRPAGFRANDFIPFFIPIQTKLTIARPGLIVFRLYVQGKFVAETSFRAVPRGSGRAAQ